MGEEKGNQSLGREREGKGRGAQRVEMAGREGGEEGVGEGERGEGGENKYLHVTCNSKIPSACIIYGCESKS